MIHDRLWVKASGKRSILHVWEQRNFSFVPCCFLPFSFLFFVQHHLALKCLTISVAMMCITVNRALSDCKLFLIFSRRARVYTDWWNWVSQMHVTQWENKFMVQGGEFFPAYSQLVTSGGGKLSLMKREVCLATRRYTTSGVDFRAATASSWDTSSKQEAFTLE